MEATKIGENFSPVIQFSEALIHSRTYDTSNLRSVKNYIPKLSSLMITLLSVSSHK